MNTSPDQATEIFAQGFNCAQAVLAGCSEGLGLTRDQALAVAGAFGGGIGGTGRVCGAVAGAVMVIGLRCPRLKAEDQAAKEKTARLTRELITRFEKRNGTIQCKELLGLDLSDSEQAQQAHKQGLFKTVCPKAVRDAAEILDELFSSAS